MHRIVEAARLDLRETEAHEKQIIRPRFCLDMSKIILWSIEMIEAMADQLKDRYAMPFK